MMEGRPKRPRNSSCILTVANDSMIRAISGVISHPETSNSSAVRTFAAVRRKLPLSRSPNLSGHLCLVNERSIYSTIIFGIVIENIVPLSMSELTSIEP